MSTPIGQTYPGQPLRTYSPSTDKLKKLDRPSNDPIQVSKSTDDSAYDPLPRNQKIPIATPEEMKMLGGYTEIVGQFIHKLEEVQDIYFTILKSETRNLQDALLVIMMKVFGASDTIHEKDQEASYWDFFKKLAFCVLAATMIAVGAITISTGQGILAILGGVSMMGSGTATVACAIMAEANVDKEVTEVVSYIGAGLGIISGASQAFFTSTTIPDLLSKIALATMGVIAHFAKAAGAVTQMSLERLKAEKSVNEGDIDRLQQEFQGLTSDMQNAYTAYEDNMRTTAAIARKYQTEMQTISAFSGPLSAA